ncbi:hypothetical protein [Acinetobacter sp.]|uniref:hypothetical protein n=1 Tax=Acinetobacter sp. TaxID=472 RepID=UPI00388EF0BE
MMQELKAIEQARQDMKLQAMQIAFEKAQAIKYDCDYEELKFCFDNHENLTGHRYPPTSQRYESWLVWQESWKAAQEHMLQARYDKLSSHDYVLIPAEMSGEIAEAIAHNANCCGGIAYDIYQAIIQASKQYQ